MVATAEQEHSASEQVAEVAELPGEELELVAVTEKQMVLAAEVAELQDVQEPVVLVVNAELLPVAEFVALEPEQKLKLEAEQSAESSVSGQAEELIGFAVEIVA